MKFEIIHKTTNEIRSGEWDSEYLIFLSDGGNVSWDEYHHWTPYESPKKLIKIAKSRVTEPYVKSRIRDIEEKIKKLDIELWKLRRELRDINSSPK